MTLEASMKMASKSIPMVYRVLYVHRNLGPGFTHFDNIDCPCSPVPVDRDYNEEEYNRHRNTGGCEAQEAGGCASAGAAGEGSSEGDGSDRTGPPA